MFGEKNMPNHIGPDFKCRCCAGPSAMLPIMAMLLQDFISDRITA